MKNLLKENWFKIALLAIFIFYATFYFVMIYAKSPNNIVARPYVIGFPLDISKDITCKYPQLVNGTYKNYIITHELPPRETNPFIFTFSDLKKDLSKLKWVDSTQTISETSIAKLFENKERIVFIEGNGNAYFVLHTIFKQDGVSLYSKQVSLLGTPFTTAAVGTCINN